LNTSTVQNLVSSPRLREPSCCNAFSSRNCRVVTSPPHPIRQEKNQGQAQLNCTLGVGTMQSFVTERAQWYNILTLSWVAPYFSPGSRLFTQRHAVKPTGANVVQSFDSTCASERGLGDCAHVKDVVFIWSSLAYAVQALFVYHTIFLFWFYMRLPIFFYCVYVFCVCVYHVLWLACELVVKNGSVTGYWLE